jgi:lipid A 3-O-deacylase
MPVSNVYWIMKNQLISLFFLLISTVDLSGQTDSLNSVSDSYFSLNYDNDFFRGTDRYYTQGIIVDLTNQALRRDPAVKILLKLNEGTKYYGIKLEQDCFTPRSIRHNSIYYGERPYSAIFFLGCYVVSMNKIKKQRLTSEIELGVMGPYAFGREEQMGIHKGLNNLQPLGWEYQIKTDVIVNYNTEYERGIVGNKFFGLIGSTGFRAGTLYDDISCGFQIRTGWMHSYFEDLGMSKKQGSKKFQCFFYIREKGRGILYNSTLEGGLFNRTSIYTIPDKDMKRITSQTSFGLVLAYGHFSVEFAETYLTKEFSTGLDHGWGHCNLKLCF